ncbi:MAG: hypothetical protein R3A51_10200 [Nannocystaceae bacterium]
MRALLEALGRDPTRRRRRRAQQVIGVLALAGLATALWIGRDRTRALVEDREARAAQAQAQASRADEEARREADRARDEADRADATRLVALARARLGDDPTYGLLLAAQAVALLEARGEPPLPVAEQALRDALDAVRSAPLDQGAAPIERLALTTGGEQIATARRDGGVTLWRLDDAGRPRPRPLTRARTARALGLDFSPRGDALVVTDADGALALAARRRRRAAAAGAARGRRRRARRRAAARARAFTCP